MKKSVNLDKEKAKKNRKAAFIVFSCIVTTVLLYLALFTTSYQNTNSKAADNFIVDVGAAFNEVKEDPSVLYTFTFRDKHGSFAKLKDNLLVFGIIDFIVLAFLWFDEIRHAHDLSNIEHGSARWENDYKGFGKEYSDPDADNNTLLSKNVALAMNTRKTLRNNNTLVIGGSGAGKTRYMVKPNVLQMNCNYVVTDPSGELLETTGAALKDAGYDVKVFNLVQMQKSNCYNPFHYIRSDAGVMMMINCLIKNTTPPEQHQGDPFWEKSEIALLLALCFYLRDYRPVEEQNFATVMELLRWAEIDEKNPDKESKLDRIFLKSKKPNMMGRDTFPSRFTQDVTSDEGFVEYLKKSRYVDQEGNTVLNANFLSLEEIDVTGTSIAVKQYKTFKMGAGKTAKSILISCAVRLNAFNIPEVARLTREDDIHLEELGGTSKAEGRKKQALFVIIPAADSTFNFLVSMMYSQLFETLYFVAETQCQKQRLPRHVKFLLDEFSNIGTIPEFTKKLATMRKYEISCTVILQNLAQIKTMYKDDWESIVGNCDSMLFLGGKEYTTLEYLSKELGDQTITTHNRSSNKGNKGGGSDSYSTQARKLMTPEELGGMPNNKCVVMIRGLDPFLDYKYDYLAHPRYPLTGDANDDNKFINILDNSGPTEREIAIDSQAILCEMETEDDRPNTIEDVISSKPEWKQYPEYYKAFKLVPERELTVPGKLIPDPSPDSSPSSAELEPQDDYYGNDEVEIHNGYSSEVQEEQENSTEQDKDGTEEVQETEKEKKQEPVPASLSEMLDGDCQEDGYSKVQEDGTVQRKPKPDTGVAPALSLFEGDDE